MSKVERIEGVEKIQKRLLKEFAGNKHTLNFGGALADAIVAHVSIKAFHRNTSDQARSTENLNRTVCHTAYHF
jgi:hypothetical protein